MPSSENARPDDATTSVGLVTPEGPPAQLADAVGPEYASWGQRVVAALLDNAILAGVTWLTLGAGFASLSLTPGFGADGEPARIADPLILVPIATLVILLVLQAVTGWTPGKLVVGIRVVREETHRPAGPWTTASRWVLHLLDAILLIGYLRPIWHTKRQTFADGLAHTVVVQEMPDLPRRPRITLYWAAIVVCVLGLGYGCVPLDGGGTTPVSGTALCELDGPGPYLTTGEIVEGGSVSTDRDQRLWTVRETRTLLPGATITWASDPSVRDVGYRVELDARPGSETGTPVVSRSWDIGTGGDADDWSAESDHGMSTHTRTTAPDGDIHVAQVEVADGDGATRDLGTDVWIDVRLIADDEVVAACGGPMTYP